MDIAAMATIMKQSQVQDAASISVMKMAMNTAATNGDAITKLADDTVRMMQQSLQPHLGGNLDVMG